MRLFRILKRPIITEKTSNMEFVNSSYVFEVDSSATKIDIKKAVLDLYGVETDSVNIVQVREKFKFGKKWMQTRRSSSKKAYVTLKNKKEKIDFSIVK